MGFNRVTIACECHIDERFILQQLIEHIGQIRLVIVPAQTKLLWIHGRRFDVAIIVAANCCVGAGLFHWQRWREWDGWLTNFQFSVCFEGRKIVHWRRRLECRRRWSGRCARRCTRFRRNRSTRCGGFWWRRWHHRWRRLRVGHGWPTDKKWCAVWYDRKFKLIQFALTASKHPHAIILCLWAPTFFATNKTFFSSLFHFNNREWHWRLNLSARNLFIFFNQIFSFLFDVFILFGIGFNVYFVASTVFYILMVFPHLESTVEWRQRNNVRFNCFSILFFVFFTFKMFFLLRI